jgi:anti-anti-sigma factor
MRCTEQQRDGATTVVTVVSTAGLGDTTSNVTDVVSEIAAGQSGHVVLDVTGVTSLDSYELGDLIGAQQSAAQHGSSMELRHVQPRVREVLMAMNLDKVFGLTADGHPG